MTIALESFSLFAFSTPTDGRPVCPSSMITSSSLPPRFFRLICDLRISLSPSGSGSACSTSSFCLCFCDEDEDFHPRGVPAPAAAAESLFLSFRFSRSFFYSRFLSPSPPWSLLRLFFFFSRCSAPMSPTAFLNFRLPESAGVTTSSSSSLSTFFMLCRSSHHSALASLPAHPAPVPGAPSAEARSECRGHHISSSTPIAPRLLFRRSRSCSFQSILLPQVRPCARLRVPSAARPAGAARVAAVAPRGEQRLTRGIRQRRAERSRGLQRLAARAAAALRSDLGVDEPGKR